MDNTTESTRLFVDMDGTLARFHDEVQYLERMFEKGFFRNLKPFDQAVLGVKEFIKNNPNVEVFILSGAVDGEPPYCQAEKHQWLDRHLPEIDRDHRIFTTVGQHKSLFVPNGITKRDFLWDDYNVSLMQWELDGGSSIKCHNNINHKGLIGKKWQGAVVQNERNNIAQMLTATLTGKEIAQTKSPTVDTIDFERAYTALEKIEAQWNKLDPNEYTPAHVLIDEYQKFMHGAEMMSPMSEEEEKQFAPEINFKAKMAEYIADNDKIADFEALPIATLDEMYTQCKECDELDALIAETYSRIAYREENDGRIRTRMMDEFDSLRGSLDYHVDHMTSEEVMSLENDFSIDYEIAIKTELWYAYTSISDKLSYQEIAAIAELKEPLDDMYRNEWLKNDYSLGESFAGAIKQVAKTDEVYEFHANRSELFNKIMDNFLDTVEPYYHGNTNMRLGNVFPTTMMREIVLMIQNDNVPLTDNEITALYELKYPLYEIYDQWATQKYPVHEPFIETIKDFAKGEVQWDKKYRKIQEQQVKALTPQAASHDKPKQESTKAPEKKKVSLAEKLKAAQKAVMPTSNPPTEKHEINKNKGGR